MTCLSATACTLNEGLAIHEKNNLPSPPNSSCGEERELELATTTTTTTTTTITTTTTTTSPVSAKAAVHYTTDSSENYTIDHSKPHTIQQAPYTLKSPKDHRVASTKTPSLTASTSSSSSSSSGSLKRLLPFTSDDDDHSDMENSSKATEKKRKKPALSDTHRCDECGKLYKHLKSLFKHQWEHSEYWEASSKLSLTKHQQVQLLEAASILTGMKKQAMLEQARQQGIENEEDDDDDDFEQQQEAFEEGDDEDDEEKISLM
ncbi:uncharacterized protein ATC70_007504 [Mucor velutinosus]|uniref:C2H2-type domain-containing protein n=1 Tax=Mucor velutinosus TaxID=708070 RepID=A0AAN7D2Y4_9FUNG|nr:hypothetical protein ATC70_007504 [Mucor velutinosus]